MAGKQWIKWAALGALMAATGCCRFCEHWCGPDNRAAAGYQAPCCQPVQPCCVPCCPPGTVPSHYQPTQPVPQQPQPGQPGQTWQRTYTQPVSYNNCCE
ncbi:hypothetical protein AYO44_02910 [Planctomycetaceae bacterium SCGC AG-212-F19]|nr:hypothetical protein AYO44_02910 [Planctomycetaceae bacterium SCGC AG-212-F19]